MRYERGPLRRAPGHFASPARWCPTCGAHATVSFDLETCHGLKPFSAHPLPQPKTALYASRTGTRENLAALAENGWRLLATPHQLHRYPDPVPPWRYGLDNGAWTAHEAGTPFDGDLFLRAVDELALLADWIVLPDVVAGGQASLDLSLSWLPRLRGACPLLLLPVQDGMVEADVAELVGPDLGIFVGGTTDWKESTLDAWAALGRRRGCYVHVGRVNTRRRLRLCIEAGVDSTDGTAATMYSVRAFDIARWAAEELAREESQGRFELVAPGTAA